MGAITSNPSTSPTSSRKSYDYATDPDNLYAHDDKRGQTLYLQEPGPGGIANVQDLGQMGAAGTRNLKLWENSLWANPDSGANYNQSFVNSINKEKAILDKKSKTIIPTQEQIAAKQAKDAQDLNSSLLQKSTDTAYADMTKVNANYKPDSPLNEGTAWNALGAVVGNKISAAQSKYVLDFASANNISPETVSDVLYGGKGAGPNADSLAQATAVQSAYTASNPQPIPQAGQSNDGYRAALSKWIAGMPNTPVSVHAGADPTLKTSNPELYKQFQQGITANSSMLNQQATSLLSGGGQNLSPEDKIAFDQQLNPKGMGPAGYTSVFDPSINQASDAYWKARNQGAGETEAHQAYFSTPTVTPLPSNGPGISSPASPKPLGNRGGGRIGGGSQPSLLDLNQAYGSLG